ncbi:MAG TPA: carboxypeptidase-like regulatory domain-containing protein, partial [Saprospiraceae bacterium]|nr:carboxypeptidase-like regulatory domain-containing protein [Saprospiraceae bacterium]
MKKLLLAFLSLVAMHHASAQFAVSGRITDSQGQALLGVNVAEKGTSHGTVTDLDGSYSITVANGDAVLVYSYVGYETQEIKVAGSSSIDVVMDEGINLGEVQVVGSRSYKRSSTDTPVAVDVIDIAELSANSGKPEINQ